MITISKLRPRVLGTAALVGLFLFPQAARAQSPSQDSGTEPTSTEAPAPSTDDTAPDDTGIVHSWALAPGDGSQGAGNRTSLSYELAPGATTDDLVTLFNLGNEQLTFRVYATDAFNNEDGSFNLLPGDQNPTDVGTWVTMPIDSVTVPPGKMATIPISIHVPVDARPGDHVGAVLASSATVGTGPEQATITLDRRAGSRIYVRVDGPLHPELTVENLKTSYDASANPAGGSAEVSYTIANRGNVRLAGTQQVSVAGPLGLLRKSLEEEDIPELLPGETMQVTRKIESAPATGVLVADVDLHPKSPAGGDEFEATGSSSSMVALPYTLIALGLLLILGTFARRAFKRHRNAVPEVELIEPPTRDVVDAEVVEHQRL